VAARPDDGRRHAPHVDRWVLRAGRPFVGREGIRSLRRQALRPQGRFEYRAKLTSFTLSDKPFLKRRFSLSRRASFLMANAIIRNGLLEHLNDFDIFLNEIRDNYLLKK
jgi:hypothetical protein